MNSILREITTSLETERLVLRMPQVGDGTVVNQAILASLDEMFLLFKQLQLWRIRKRIFESLFLTLFVELPCVF